MDLTSQLIQAFSEHPHGLCGHNDPVRVIQDVVDLEQRLNILALGVVLDINPLSEERWSILVSLAGYWLLEPSQVAYRSSQQVQAIMKEMGILGPRHIPRVWWQLCRGVQGRFKGSWRALIASGQDDARKLGEYLRQNKATFPVLAGPVISARWLDLIHRMGYVELKAWEDLRVPLPKGEKKTAGLIGIESTEVHPLLFSALHSWTIACQKLNPDSCGFANCPKKKSR